MANETTQKKAGRPKIKDEDKKQFSALMIDKEVYKQYSDYCNREGLKISLFAERLIKKALIDLENSK